MNVLVTGGAGYIGSHTVRRLVDLGHRVTVLDTLEHGSAAAVQTARLVVGSVLDRPLVASLLGREGIDAVVHFAAYKSVEESIAEPGRYFENNVAGSLALLESCRAAGVGRFVFSSSCAVYGTPDQLPVAEDAALRPDNPYGESKRIVEDMLRWYGSSHHLRYASLRYFNAAGASSDGRLGEDWTGAANLVPIVLKTALGRGPAVRIFGTDYPTPDGTAVRDYVHVDDLADAHVAALEYLAAGGAPLTVNLGTGRGSSVLEVLEAARRASGAPVPAVAARRRPGDPAAVWADPRLAREVLGWTARHGLDEIVASAYRWHASGGGTAPRDDTRGPRVRVLDSSDPGVRVLDSSDPGQRGLKPLDYRAHRNAGTAR
jgi:UDP-glucose-4-epimerase GalE